MKIQKNRAIYIGLLIIVWACAYVYIFNEKIENSSKKKNTFLDFLSWYKKSTKTIIKSA